ncbi:acetyl-CoA carboxylase biotin carboxyl carrier protein subunit [Sphingomonas sp. MMS24-JH45]
MATIGARRSTAPARRWRNAGSTGWRPIFPCSRTCLLARDEVADGRVETGWFDTVADAFATVADVAPGDPLTAIAPLTGVVVAIAVAPGDRVAAGTEVATIEALKMQHAVLAPRAGMVRAVVAAPGATVAEGAAIVQFDAVDGEDGLALRSRLLTPTASATTSPKFAPRMPLAWTRIAALRSRAAMPRANAPRANR